MPSGSFQTKGFVVQEDALSPAELEPLRREVDRLLAESSERGGARIHPQDSEPLDRLASHGAPIRLAGEFLGGDPKPVKITLFDKCEGANWKVPFHQDVTIAIRERREVEGFGPWSEKAGIPHVQVPAAILRQMVAIRVHLDDTPAENGALRVLSGSHLRGRLTSEEIGRLRGEVDEVVCEVPAGGFHAMSPLLVHASSKAVKPGHRRVVHVEYAPVGLPGGLEWA